MPHKHWKEHDQAEVFWRVYSCACARKVERVSSAACFPFHILGISRKDRTAVHMVQVWRQQRSHLRRLHQRRSKREQRWARRLRWRRRWAWLHRCRDLWWAQRLKSRHIEMPSFSVVVTGCVAGGWPNHVSFTHVMHSMLHWILHHLKAWFGALGNNCICEKPNTGTSMSAPGPLLSDISLQKWRTCAWCVGEGEEGIALAWCFDWPLSDFMRPPTKFS